MSRSFKTEGVAAGNADARKAAQQRRNARRSKRNVNENDSHLKTSVDARPAYPRRWTPPGRA